MNLEFVIEIKVGGKKGKIISIGKLGKLLHYFDK